MTGGGPGFAALWTRDGATPSLSAAAAVVFPDSHSDGDGPVQVASWNSARLVPGSTVLLTREARCRDTTLTEDQVGDLLQGQGSGRLAQMLPTFGAVSRRQDGTLVACTDALGFEHVYTRSGPGWAAVSTSARVLGVLGGPAVDREAVAVQSLLGWQLGQRTIFGDVAKLPAGHAVTLSAVGLRLHRYTTEGEPAPLPMPQAVCEARDLLRGYLAAYLDDHPDAILQLTGGQDSRLLLSAIAPGRRRGLHVMTLDVPGSADARIAGELAQRYGMDHEVTDLTGLDDLPPDVAAELVVEAAGRLEAGADPVARAALDFAESSAAPGPRISGLGGEVARGFYYLGPRSDGPVTRARARRLADWRMFANDAVDPSALDPEFAAWSREVAVDAVHDALAASGRRWFAATDSLYLDHRMQRWAGATETAVAGRRRIANPMLDDRFVSTATALRPQDKRGGRFLARLQVALDEELAGIRLDGRAAPRAYAGSRWTRSAAQARTTLDKVARKTGQRLGGARRPPAGGEVLTDLLVRHWHDDPSALEAAAQADVLRHSWLEQVAEGRQAVTPGTAALVVNLGLLTPPGRRPSRSAL